MDDARDDWTLDDLVRRAELALAGSAQAGTYAGAPNGRVRELPDQRVIRWYTSTGLVDRPIGGRGRGSRYGVRHLRQLVAVKLLQSQGLPLADIQARLAGIPDDDLALLAPLPDVALGRLSSSSAGSVPPAPPAPPAPVEPVARADTSRSPRQRFWAVEVPVTHLTHPTAGGSAPPEAAGPPEAAAPPEAAGPPAAGLLAVEALAGVRLAPGVLLVLPVSPGADDLAALAEAARPLIATLTDRGLIPRSASPAGPTEGAHR